MRLDIQGPGVSGWPNTPASFGWTTRALRWAAAALVPGLLPLGLRPAGSQPSLGTLWLLGLRTWPGPTALLLTLARLLWHALSPPPLDDGIAPRQRALARGMRRGLHALLLLVPLAGGIGASATGIGTRIRGLPVPAIAPASEAWDRWGFRAHAALAALLAAPVALQVAGALARHLLHRDATRRRMLRGA